MKKIILFTVIGIFLLIPTSFARDVVSDWYVKDFQAEIIVNKDSSLLITENIIADCGNLPDKHGIFRILPIKATTPNETILSPIELISITDFDGNPYKYSTIKNNDTITWKIGDPNKTIIGENNYKIVYRVENTIRFSDSEFDEFYWNVLGNFWEMEIDNFRVKISFPEGINRNNTTVEAYSGEIGGRLDDLTGYRWYTNSILEVFNAQILRKGQGITVSVVFPKNIFTQYQLGFFEKYSGYLLFLLPIIVFILCYLIWKKYGKDPRVHKTIIPEFEIPGNLSPLEMGTLMSGGKFKNQYLSAGIINLAVNKIISIEEVPASFLKRKDYRLNQLDQIGQIDPLDELFRGELFSYKAHTEVLLSSLKNNFISSAKKISEACKNKLIEKKLITAQGLKYQKIFITIGAIILGLYFSGLLTILSLALIPSAIILIVFSYLMARRTPEGAELNWQIKGFKLYMNTAEKYRQQFNEKENIFEKFLPYAMIFGLTKEWTKKIKQIYGEDYFTNYHPIWFVGANLASFDVDNFVSNINSISKNISSHTGSSSGFGGGGFSGGGGGGGGGGGW